MSNVPLPPLSLSCRIIFTGFKKIFSFRLWVNLFGKFREIAKILKHSCNIQTRRRRKTFFWSSKVCSLTNPPCVPSKIPKEIFLPGKKSGQSKSWPGRKLDETKVNLEENRTNQKLTWKKIGQNKKMTWKISSNLAFLLASLLSLTTLKAILPAWRGEVTFGRLGGRTPD